MEDENPQVVTVVASEDFFRQGTVINGRTETGGHSI